MSGSSEFDFPISPRLSRRSFLGAGLMLPLSGVTHGTAGRVFPLRRESTGAESTSIGRTKDCIRSIPARWSEYVVLQARQKAAAAQARSSPEFWIFRRDGWRRPVTLAYKSKDKAQALEDASIEILLDEKSAGRLQPLATRCESAPPAGWLGLQYASEGSHELMPAFDTDPGSELAGISVTNGPLSYWPTSVLLSGLAMSKDATVYNLE